jgi:prevent-host-death family protein
MTYYMIMNQVNIADFKAHLSEYLEAVEEGQEIILCRRNLPVAKLIPLPSPTENRTRLGWCEGEIKIHGDLTEAQIPPEDWEMLKP